MKIAYLYQKDASDPNVQSGRPSAILRGFRDSGALVLPVFPLDVQVPQLSLPVKIGNRLRQLHDRLDRDPQYLAAAARECQERLAGVEYDYLFTPGSELVGHLKISRPIVFCADATFDNMVDYYWDFTDLKEDYLRKGRELERAALARATLAVYPSQWAADSAINDYGADPEKVMVAPFGGQLGQDNTEAEVAGWMAMRSQNEIRFLFVASNWARKGGDLVVATAECLIKLGQNVSLDVVGCEIPREHRELSWITGHGRLDPKTEEGRKALGDLFAGASFVFVPSRAEAYGLTFAEANAFGVPSIATDTGGIPGVIRSGYNGVLLPLSADERAFADAIVHLHSDRQRYEASCRHAFRHFQQESNWGIFVQRVLNRLSAGGPPMPELAKAASLPQPDTRVSVGSP